MSKQELLLVEKRGDVDWVTLNRPEQLNALNEELVDGLVHYFRNLADDHSVRVVVLKANGRAFCAGLDFSPDAFTANEKTPHIVLKLQKRIAEIYRAMRRCPQPIIALVHGAACGGGFSLALAADIRLAGESAKMNAAYITIGLTGCDMGSSYFLPRLVGTSVASELLLTGRFIKAPRALAVNLVSEVVPDDQLEQVAQGFIDDMLKTSPLGLRLTKDGINLGVDANSLDAAMAVEDRQQTLLSLTEDAGEAAAAFFSKRPPQFKDR
ncbi:MAG: enoyl-CoA hydratase/carnithine racemase [Halioglobus sp.]|jgi:enoyl-CoA hydratase/carnithine racemase